MIIANPAAPARKNFQENLPSLPGNRNFRLSQDGRMAGAAQARQARVRLDKAEINAITAFISPLGIAKRSYFVYPDVVRYYKKQNRQKMKQRKIQIILLIFIVLTSCTQKQDKEVVTTTIPEKP
jgi:hypothetical protein